MRILLSLFFSFLFFYVRCQGHMSTADIAGEYHFYSSDSLLHYSLQIRSDYSYFESEIKDLYVKSAGGTWKFNRDTLTLNSKFQIDNIHLNVSEKRTDKSEVSFDEIKNLSGYILPTALLILNNDTTQVYDPLSKVGKIKQGTVKCFQVIVDNIRSKLYYVKDLQANHFQVVLNLDSYPRDYLFMKNKKFLFQNNNLCSINAQNKIDSLSDQLNAGKLLIFKKSGK